MEENYLIPSKYSDMAVGTPFFLTRIVDSIMNLISGTLSLTRIVDSIIE